MWQKILLMWLLLVNLTGFVQMYADKRRAVRGQWRIPEKRLFLTAALGGSVGSILGMRLFRHKTKHRSFVLGMPAILLLQLMAAGAVWYYFIR